ncbi:MAG TPA: DUF3830 family protein [bacterium]|nr:DUF3830 family protein [bacterium]
MKRIGIELDGVKVTAVLYEDRAPVTVGALWASLPYEDRVTHAKWSGDMFHANTELPIDVDYSKFPFGMENPVGFQAPGEIVYLPAIRELAIAYGEARFAWVMGAMMVSALGRIEGDLTAFAKKAERLMWDGAMLLVLRRLDGADAGGAR